jgi:hypothetical protein
MRHVRLPDRDCNFGSSVALVMTWSEVTSETSRGQSSRITLIVEVLALGLQSVVRLWLP